MQKYANNFQDRYGNGIPGALVTVTSNTTGLAATIYSDDGVTPVSALLTDAVGQFAFYVADGDYNITLTKAGVGTATISDVSIKNPTPVSITDFADIHADGTDQTAKIVAWLGSLPADYTGAINIPYNTRFNFNTVSAAIPSRAVVWDYSLLNSWNTSGYLAKVAGVIDNSADANIDFSFRVSSGHNACIFLDNRGTAPSSSAAGKVGAIVWGSGQFNKGPPGGRQYGRMEFAQIQGQQRWMVCYRRFIPWGAGNWENWFATTAYAVDDHVLALNNVVYKATVAGVTSGVSPTHLSGTAVDGTVTWQFVSAQADTVIFAADENGCLATNTAPLPGVGLYLKANIDGGGGNLFIQEAVGISKTVEYRMVATDGAGAGITAVPRLRAESDGSMRLRDSTYTFDLFRATNARGFELGAHGHTEATATNLSTTPSVQNCGALLLANTGATSITNFVSTLTTQEFLAVAQNGNTTIVHGANIVLQGGVDVTLAANQVLTFHRFTGSTAWIEIGGRNF